MKVKRQQRLDKEEQSKNQIENTQKFEDTHLTIDSMKKQLLNQILEMLNEINASMNDEIGKKADRLDLKKLTPKFGKISIKY